MRIVLKCVDIDKVTYNNNYQNKPANNTNTINGYVNKERTKYTFNLNLYAMLGSQAIAKSKTFNIKLLNMICINEQGQNIIDYSSASVLRTCNIVMSGLNFCNGKNENILCQFTNIDPNREVYINKVYLHRGDLNNYLIYCNVTDSNNAANDTGSYGFFAYLYENVDGGTLTLTNGNPITNKLLTYGRFIRNSTGNNSYFDNKPFYLFNFGGSGANFRTFNWYDPTNTIPSSIPLTTDSNVGFVNQSFDFQTLPVTNQWFNNNRLNQDRHIGSNYDNMTEVSAYIPQAMTDINITFELRDLLNNQLIIPANFGENNKVYPCIEFVLEIY